MAWSRPKEAILVSCRPDHQPLRQNATLPSRSCAGLFAKRPSPASPSCTRHKVGLLLVAQVEVQYIMVTSAYLAATLHTDRRGVWLL